MIETYKLMHDIHDPILPKLLDPVEKSKTRGHRFKLPKKSAKNNIKGHVFSHRIVNDWNSLPEDVVSAPSVNALAHPTVIKTTYNWVRQPRPDIQLRSGHRGHTVRDQ